MKHREIRIRQLKSMNRALIQSIPTYDETPNEQNRILEEIKLNEEIIKYLSKL